MAGSRRWKCQASEGTRQPAGLWEHNSPLHWHWTCPSLRFHHCDVHFRKATQFSARTYRTILCSYVPWWLRSLRDRLQSSFWDLCTLLLSEICKTCCCSDNACFQLRRGMVATSPQGEQPVACIYFQVASNPTKFIALYVAMQHYNFFQLLWTCWSVPTYPDILDRLLSWFLI